MQTGRISDGLIRRCSARGLKRFYMKKLKLSTILSLSSELQLALTRALRPGPDGANRGLAFYNRALKPLKARPSLQSRKAWPFVSRLTDVALKLVMGRAQVGPVANAQVR